MMKVLVDYPSEEEEFVIAQRVTGDAACTLNAVADTHQLAALQRECRAVYLRPGVDAVRGQAGQPPASRDPANARPGRPGALHHLRRQPARDHRHGRRRQGAGLLRGRRYVLPEDLVDLVPDVLRHRLVLSYEALADNRHARRHRAAPAASTSAAARQTAGHHAPRMPSQGSRPWQAQVATSAAEPSDCCAGWSGSVIRRLDGLLQGDYRTLWRGASASTWPTCANTRTQRRRAPHRLERYRAAAAALCAAVSTKTAISPRGFCWTCRAAWTFGSGAT